MTDTRTIEETDSGWKQVVRAQVMYFDASGSFVSRADYVRERERGAPADGGYGAGGFGGTAYGGS